MIIVKDGSFHLQTKDTSYIFRENKYGKLEHLYYGPRLEEDSIESLSLNYIMDVGSSVHYSKGDRLSSMDMMRLELGEPQVGDYRHPPIDMWINNQQVTDFKVVDYHLNPKEKNNVTSIENAGLPSGHDADEILVIGLTDDTGSVRLNLIYKLFYESNVIVRQIEVKNLNEHTLNIQRLSVSLDVMNRNYHLVSFHGGWAREVNRQDLELGIGRTVIASQTGFSSNQHHPGYILEGDLCIGVNFMYSGSHYSEIERTPHEMVRISTGLNPSQFEWALDSTETFVTPAVVLTISENLEGVSDNFHGFVRNHVVRPSGRPRYIAYNHWESTFHTYKESKLLKLADKAAEIGCDLFVVDDGWFKNRDSDLTGLGNYEVDTKKFKSGMKAFGQKIKDKGLAFGLWIEPEMVSEDSDLYRAHPEYTLGGKYFGRHQLVLDLTRPEVRDYIVDNVSHVIDNYEVDYIKWDMNRHIAEINDMGKSFYHAYILGLYEVLDRIFKHRDVCLEMCASGGNRFDLGMLTWADQIWSSDNTDAIDRIEIQSSLSMLYPLSVISNHINSSVSMQVLRNVPLSTRVNVASFGLLGVEMDLSHLSPKEVSELKRQISWYKTNQQLILKGQFRQFRNLRKHRIDWQVGDGDSILCGVFQTLAVASPPPDILVVKNLEKGSYKVSAKPQAVFIERYRDLMKHVVDININPSGLIMNIANKFYTLEDQTQSLIASDVLLGHGVWLNNQFISTGYDPQIRLWGDFGSTIYEVRKQETSQ